MPEHLEPVQSQTEELQRLPRYSFVGAPIDSATAANLEIHLRGPAITPDMPHELQKTPEQRQQIDDMRDALDTFAEDIGVDMTFRRVTMGRIHLLDRRGMKAYRKKNNLEASVQGESTDAGIVVNASGSTPETLSCINHELIHLASDRKIKIDESETARYKHARVGYQVAATNAFQILNEIVTEYTNTYIKQHYWQSYASLAPHRNGHETYGPAMPLGRALIDKVAAISGRQSEDIWLELMRGALTGDMQPLRNLKDALGTEGMRILSNYKQPAPAEARRVADQFGLSLKRRRIARWYKLPRTVREKAFNEH